MEIFNYIDNINLAKLREDLIKQTLSDYPNSESARDLSEHILSASPDDYHSRLLYLEGVMISVLASIEKLMATQDEAIELARDIKDAIEESKKER